MSKAIVNLDSELTLPCGVSIPNRIAKSAMTEGLADKYDNPTQAHTQLYSRWAAGDLGLNISGNVMVDKRYLERVGNVVLENDINLAKFKEFAKAGKSNGGQFWMQISHPGRQCPRLVNSKPIAPSEVQLKILSNFGRPRAMTEEDIKDAIKRFATTAKLAKEAGFTGVQVHCAHGYLVSQFLNPLVNIRSDQWGGNLENRARFARSIIRAVREAVGPSFPVAAKLNSSDFQKGGFTLEECTQVASWLAEDRLDLLEISGGNYEQLSLMGASPSDATIRESTRKREAYFLEYAAAIKKTSNIPIMVTGGFRKREIMQQAIRDGEVDMIGLARPFCTQPELPKLLINKQIDEVDSYENQLVLGAGFWGNNSPLALIKAINAFGAVGFYYWQIIRLSKGLTVETNLKILRAFIRHILNDFSLNRRRRNADKST